jgi:hypothetical protein
VAKEHPWTELEQTCFFCWRRCLRRNSKPFGGSPDENRIANRIRRRHEQQTPGLEREGTEPPRERVLDPTRERFGAWEAKSAGQLIRRQTAW